MDLQKQIAEATEFVEKLEIEVLGSGRMWRAGQSAAFNDVQRQPPSANVVAASIVAFADGIFGQQKEDLLNSTLLAQLAANRQYDRERDTLNWYGAYRSVLVKLGWSSKKRHSGSQGSSFLGSSRPFLLNPLMTLPFARVVVVDRPRFIASTTVLNLLRKSANKNALDATQTAFETLRGLDDRDRRIVIFENSSHSSGRGNFQIVAVSAGSDGIIQMTIVAVFFTANERVLRVLSFNFESSSTQMFQATDTMTLSLAVYDTVRDRVVQQLGDQASAYIAVLD